MIRAEESLYQDQAAFEIEERFGKKFTYINTNGNRAISEDVLEAFKKLTDNKVMWERGIPCTCAAFAR